MGSSPVPLPYLRFLGDGGPGCGRSPWRPSRRPAWPAAATDSLLPARKPRTTNSPLWRTSIAFFGEAASPETHSTSPALNVSQPANTCSAHARPATSPTTGAPKSPPDAASRSCPVDNYSGIYYLASVRLVRHEYAVPRLSYRSATSTWSRANRHATATLGDALFGLGRYDEAFAAYTTRSRTRGRPSLHLQSPRQRLLRCAATWSRPTELLETSAQHRLRAQPGRKRGVGPRAARKLLYLNAGRH